MITVKMFRSFFPRYSPFCKFTRDTLSLQLCSLSQRGTNSSIRGFSGKSFNNCTDDSTEKTGPDKACNGKPRRWPSGERARFKFHQDTEDIMNNQINVELKAFYYYLSMASYFGRVDVSLPGCESFFTQMHDEEHEHAMRFLNYVNMRGGKVNLCPIEPPSDQDWKCPLHAFQTALRLEMEVSEKLVAVNSVAEKHGDLNASDFIITGFMEDQMESVNEMARLVTILSGVGDQSLARLIFDKYLLENYVQPGFNVFERKPRHDGKRR